MTCLILFVVVGLHADVKQVDDRRPTKLGKCAALRVTWQKRDECAIRLPADIGERSSSVDGFICLILFLLLGWREFRKQRAGCLREELQKYSTSSKNCKGKLSVERVLFMTMEGSE